MTKAKDVADLARDGELPADVAEGAVPMGIGEAREKARALGEAQVKPEEMALPSDVPAERELLSALLWAGAYSASRLQPSAVTDVLDRDGMFFLSAHGAIWSACVAVAEAGTPPSPVAVHSELVKRRHEKTAGGLDYLETLVREARPTSEVVARRYAQTIREAWVRRNLIVAAAKIEKLARTGAGTALDVAADSVSHVTAIAAAAATTDGSHIRLNKALSDMVKDLTTVEVREAVKTGFRDIDDETGGLFIGETSVLAARTSVGKSALASQIAMNIAKDPKMAVYYVSLEMQAKLFAGRIAASMAQVEQRRIRRKEVTQSELNRLFAKVSEIATRHVYFVDSQIQTLASIHAGAKALRRKLGMQGIRLGLIVIDHVGLVKPSAELARAKSFEKFGETSRGLRFLATEHECHVMGIAHINRDGAAGGKETTPQLHHLRGGDDAANDADNVFILHRERSSKGSFTPGRGADFIIAKARSDRTAELRLALDDEFVRFRDADE